MLTVEHQLSVYINIWTAIECLC